MVQLETEKLKQRISFLETEKNQIENEKEESVKKVTSLLEKEKKTSELTVYELEQVNLFFAKSTNRIFSFSYDTPKFLALPCFSSKFIHFIISNSTTYRWI